MIHAFRVSRVPRPRFPAQLDASISIAVHLVTMLRKGTRNLDSFLSAIARHLSLTGQWDIEHEGADAGEIVHFGKAPDMRGELISDDPDEVSPSGLILLGGGYDDDDLVVIERAIALLEGLEYVPDPPADDDDDL